MTKLNLIKFAHILPSSIEASLPIATCQLPTAKPQKKFPLLEGEGEDCSIHNHNEWKAAFLEGGDVINVTLGEDGANIQISKLEVLDVMDALYQQYIQADKDPTGIYEVAKSVVVSRKLRKVEKKERAKSKAKAKGPRPSWVNPAYRGK